jgi:hypothetical protein
MPWVKVWGAAADRFEIPPVGAKLPTPGAIVAPGIAEEVAAAGFIEFMNPCAAVWPPIPGIADVAVVGIADVAA